MARRLTTLSSKVQGSFKTGRLNVKFKLEIKSQPRYPEFKQYLSPPRDCFSKGQRKTLDKLLRPCTCNNGGAAKMQGKGTGGNKKNDKRVNNVSSKSPTKSAPKVNNPDSNSGGNGHGERDRKKNRPWPGLDVDCEHGFAILGFFCILVIGRHVILVWGQNWKETNEKSARSDVTNEKCKSEARKTLEKSVCPKTRSRNKIKGKGTEEKEEIDKRTNNAFSTSPPKSAPKARNQGSNSGGNNGCARRNRKKNSPGPAVDEHNTADDQLTRSRELKLEYKSKTKLQDQMTSGTSTEFASSLVLKSEHYGEFDSKALVTRSLEIKADHKTEAPVLNKKKTRK